LTVAVPSDHPSLPGHFPGHPVVPGAVILTEICHAAASTLGLHTRVTGLPTVKFVNPMLPAQPCELALTDKGAGLVSFELTHEGRRLVSGNLRYERT
jgi:3-hydroxymyristoyl/3-hydroxydecanoyl-(acyl carrier protein) dehydratase